MKRNIPSFWLITLGFVIIKLTIHFLTYNIYELHRDEMLYFAQGNHLGFGYMSTPPFIGFLAFIAKSVFGYSEFGIKLFPALTGAASLVIIALFVKEMRGKNMALILACTAFLVSAAFLRSNSLFQPVSFDQFFWFLSAYLIFRMVNRNEPKLWIWIGVVFALGFLNKYSIVFFAGAVLLALLISEHRRIMLSKYFVFGFVLGILIVTPNLIWQQSYNWPVVRHMVNLQRTQLVNVSTSGYLTDQLMMCAPALFIWLAGLIVVLAAKSEKRLRYISYTFIFVVSIILIGRGKSYYTLGAYPMLFVTGGYVLEKYLTKRWVIVNYLTLILGIASSIFALPLELPVASFETVKRICNPENGFAQIWEDGKVHPIPQDYADMTGWKELAALVSKAYQQLDESDKIKCTVFAENYGQAGAIQFYGHRYGLPEPISFSDSYLLWAPDSMTDGPLIYINHNIGNLEDLFKDCKEIGRVDNEYFRENGLKVFFCNNQKLNAKRFYAQNVRMLKNDLRKTEGCKNALAINTKHVIEAEDCCDYSGVQTEFTTDTTGNLNVGWVDPGDWMEYKIDVTTTGKYQLIFRVASESGGGSFTISSDETDIETISIPSTGAWQNWTTISATINLNAGIQLIRFTAPSGGWNMNWWGLEEIDKFSGEAIINTTGSSMHD